MGLQISEIVPKKEINLEDLKGETLAVDAFNTLYQFLANIRQMDGTPLMDDKKRVTSHLSGLFYRTINLMIKGIKLIFVFDGKSPELKAKTAEARMARKEKAKEKYEKAKKDGKEDEMFKWSRQTLRLDDEMISESKELLKALGIPVVQASGEGEAQAACISAKKEAYAVASQDYDALLFGTPRLIQNVTLAKKRRTPSGAYVSIQPTMIELDVLLDSLKINRDQLICLGILIGTDFNPRGVKGIGQKKALKFVQQHKQPAMIFKALNEQIKEGKFPEIEFDWKKIFEIFKKPDVIKKYNLKFEKINKEKVKKILCEKHDFSENRIESAFNRIQDYEKKASQKDLKNWF